MAEQGDQAAVNKEKVGNAREPVRAKIGLTGGGGTLTVPPQLSGQIDYFPIFIPALISMLPILPLAVPVCSGKCSWEVMRDVDVYAAITWSMATAVFFAVVLMKSNRDPDQSWDTFTVVAASGLAIMAVVAMLTMAASADSGATTTGTEFRRSWQANLFMWLCLAVTGVIAAKLHRRHCSGFARVATEGDLRVPSEKPDKARPN